MSPYEIEILLHYYYSGRDHPAMDEGRSAWQCAIAKFKEERLIEENKVGMITPAALYRLSGRGKFYIEEGVLKVPLPVPTWTFPESTKP